MFKSSHLKDISSISHPKVSIIVPIYNAEKYLKKCLISLVKQYLHDIEIICIDDGSTDDSLEIITEFAKKDNRIVFLHKSNSGYGHTMNTGLSLAKGEYIGIIEPDDFAKLTMFNDLYQCAKKHDADVVKSDYYHYTKLNKLIRKAGKIPFFKSNKITNIEKDPSLLKITPSIWSAIYKKDFLVNNNIKFLETPGASYQDTSFSFKALSLAKKIALLSNAYVHYRQDNEHSSINKTNKVFAICNEFDEITDFLNKNPEIKKIVNSQKLIKQYKTYIWNLKRISEEHREEFIDKFSETFKVFYENGELDEEFCKKYKEEEILMLINDKKAFLDFINKMIEEDKNQKERRKLFSVRINPSRISIILFGKKILEVG